MKEVWRRPSKGRGKLPLQAIAPPNNQAMEGNFGCLLLVGWVGRGGWLVGSGGTSVQLPWPSNTVHKLSVVKQSFKIQVFLFQNTRVFRILLPYLELTETLLIIIGDGGDSNEQAHSGADEDIKQQAVEEKVGNSPKNKNTH